MLAADSPAIITVFRSLLRPDAASKDYHELAGGDGERVSIVVFDNIEHHNAWRDDPQHIAAQQRGIEDFDTAYQITVGQVIRQHGHSGGASESKTREVGPGGRAAE